MRKKVILASLFALAMLLLPAVQAVPILGGNNDKFETFNVTVTEKFADLLIAPHYYIPSTEAVNKLVIIEQEIPLTCQITIDTKTYELNEDFTYFGQVKYSVIDPEFNNPQLGMKWPSEEKLIRIIVDYEYDFSAVPGGIDGTLKMHAERLNDAMHINSLAGTGDLQNVQIHATLGPGGLSAGILTITHTGTVSGWPE